MTRLGHAPLVLAGITLFAAAGCVGGALSGDETNRNELGIQCAAQLKVDGTFTPSAAQPSDVYGCWPVGTWRFTATVDNTDCAQPPELAPEYTFEVTRDADEALHISYVNDPAYPNVKLKVSSGGAGLCEGGFEVFSTDGTSVFNFKPDLGDFGKITGKGEYLVYNAPKM